MQLKCSRRVTLWDGIVIMCLLYIFTVLIFYYGIEQPRKRSRIQDGGERGHPLPFDFQGGEKQKPITQLPLYIRQRSRLFSPKWRAMKEDKGRLGDVRGRHYELRPDVRCTGNSRGREYEFVEVVPGKLFVFSAYFDDRENDFDNRHNGSYIRVISVLRGPSNGLRLVCRFRDDSGFQSQTKVSYYEMCENHGRPFGGYILSCPVPSDITTVPCIITVSEETAAATEYGIKVLALRSNQNKDTFRVCVPPLFGKVNAKRIIEFVETSRLLGAQRIVFYDYQIIEETAQVLEYYQNKGYVDVIPWLYPDVLDRRSWYHGQLVAVQDCLYRNMAHTDYLLFNDLDEYVVPHEFDNWQQLVRAEFQKDQCAFQFNSALFPDVNENETIVLTARRRTEHFSRMRTKCMVRPFLVFEKGIHHVSKPIWAWLAVKRMPENKAFVHHYRPCDVGFDLSCKDFVEDMTMLKYGRNITTNMEKTVSHLHNDIVGGNVLK